MKQMVRFTLVSMILFASLAAAQQIPPQADFQGTPPPFKLLQNQWQSFSSVAPGYSLDFLRTAEREAVQLSLKDAILTGLKNNPGLEVERLDPLRIAEQTLNEKSIFDPSLNL